MSPKEFVAYLMECVIKERAAIEIKWDDHQIVRLEMEEVHYEYGKQLGLGLGRRVLDGNL